MKQKEIIPGFKEAEMQVPERTRLINKLYDKAYTALSSIPEYRKALHESFMAGETINGIKFKRGKYEYVITASDKQYPLTLNGEKKLGIFRKTHGKSDSGQQIEIELKYRLNDTDYDKNGDENESDYTTMQPHYADIYLDSSPQDMSTPPQKNTRHVITTASNILDELLNGK